MIGWILAAVLGALSAFLMATNSRRHDTIAELRHDKADLAATVIERDGTIRRQGVELVQVENTLRETTRRLEEAKAAEHGQRMNVLTLTGQLNDLRAMAALGQSPGTDLDAELAQMLNDGGDLR